MMSELVAEVLETLLCTSGKDITDDVFCTIEVGAIGFAPMQSGSQNIPADRSTSTGPSRSR